MEAALQRVVSSNPSTWSTQLFWLEFGHNMDILYNKLFSFGSISRLPTSTVSCLGEWNTVPSVQPVVPVPAYLPLTFESGTFGSQNFLKDFLPFLNLGVTFSIKSTYIKFLNFRFIVFINNILRWTLAWHDCSLWPSQFCICYWMNLGDFFFRLKSIFKTGLGLKEMIVFVWSCLQNSETVISLLLAFSFKLKSQWLGALTKIRDNDFTVQYCSSHKAPMTFFNVAVIHSFIFRSFWKSCHVHLYFSVSWLLIVWKRCCFQT